MTNQGQRTEVPSIKVKLCFRHFSVSCLILTWTSWDPGELGQVLGLPDHHFDPLGQNLVLQQDQELSQISGRTD